VHIVWWWPGARQPGLLGKVNVFARKDRLGEVDHGDTPVHGPLLDSPEGLSFGPSMFFHEYAFGALDNLTILQRLSK
jgi:hypothetical protein